MRKISIFWFYFISVWVGHVVTLIYYELGGKYYSYLIIPLIVIFAGLFLFRFEVSNDTK